jgi:hypothetical protein
MHCPKIATVTLTLVLLATGLAHGAPPKPFEVVLVPDTQNYSEKYPDTYLTQTRWIRDNAEARNIKFAVHLGDIVQTAAVEDEWKVADAAQRILEGHVPYSVVPGNHDLDIKDKALTRGVTMYHKYFPPSRFTKYPWYGGHMGEDNACNYAYFEQDGLKFMVLSFAFAPSDEMLAWAAGVIAKHPDHRVIVATHYYLRPKGRGKGGTYGIDGCDGEMLWDKFVRKQPNVFLVVCGHVLGVHHQISTNDTGKPVIELLCDYQGEANGGDGWLQTMRFVPVENKIHVKAYSPTLDAHREEAPHSYSLDYAMVEK